MKQVKVLSMAAKRALAKRSAAKREEAHTKPPAQEQTKRPTLRIVSGG